MEKQLITKNDIIKQGLKEGTARKVIHEAKMLLVNLMRNIRLSVYDFTNL